MTILTPTFTEMQQLPQSNGQAGPHVLAPHEPTREGEVPQMMVMMPNGQMIPMVPVNQAPQGPLKVALVGTAPSSRELAPYDDLSWKIWACSPGNMNVCKRVDAWFELHSNLLWKEHEHYGKPYLEWLNKQPFPIYMQNNNLVPRAVPYPWYDMVQAFGKDFFTSSFAWMMALAITQGAQEIALYGVDMASREEYIRQRPGFYYFKRRAEERGCKVFAPHESDIMQPPALYAYQDSTPQGRKLMARKAEVSGRVAQHDQAIQQNAHNKAYLQGALEDIDYQESIWIGVSTDLMIETEKNARLTAQNAALQAEIARLSGALAEHAPHLVTGVAANAEAPQPERKRRQRRQRVKAAPMDTIIADDPHAPMEAQNG